MGLLNRRGSILLEGALALGLVVFSTVLAVEICRRSWFEIAAQQSAFIAARDTILGESRTGTYRDVERFASTALGEKIGSSLVRQFRRSPLAILQAGEARVKFRFPALVRFPIGGHEKHHFEITKTCRFPFSY